MARQPHPSQPGMPARPARCGTGRVVQVIQWLASRIRVSLACPPGRPAAVLAQWLRPRRD
jgi:hypothetical protein